jgi:hypothetical protein
LQQTLGDDKIRLVFGTDYGHLTNGIIEGHSIYPGAIPAHV